MKRSLTVLVCSLLLVFGGTLFAGDPVLIDQTGTDFQTYWYVGTDGQQICVDDNGTVHAVYCKTWADAASDTGYQVMYANVTSGAKLEVPSQEPEAPVQPGLIFIDGGHNGTPVYMYYGVGSRMYSYADQMHLQAMAKLSTDGSAVEPLGLQEDQNYYANAYYANPIALNVDNVNGVAHCILTNPGGADLAYWNFDGTNFGEIYQMMSADAGSGVPGTPIPGKYRRNGTKGADLAVSTDGMEVAVVGLHPASQVIIHKGSFGGGIWPDDFFTGLDDGSVVCMFDTTGTETGDNFQNNDPKPYTQLQVVYDANNNLHIVFDCAYQDLWKDTTNVLQAINGNWDPWNRTYLNLAVGDTFGVFFDGSEHPKEQLRYWNDITMGDMITDINTGTELLALCDYPMAGDTFAWWSYGVMDSGPAMYGKYWDGLISNVELIANWDPQEGEPMAVCVWEEMGAPATVLVDEAISFFYNYYAYTHDVKASVLTDAGWSAATNLTNTPDLDETGVSLYKDVIDNEIHMMWYSDNWGGRDRILVYQDEYQDRFLTYAPPSGGHFSVPIRKNSEDLVNIYYQAISVDALTSIEPSNNFGPVKFEMAQNYPNPFNPTTSITYTVPAGSVKLTVYDLLGQKVKTLVNEDKVAGAYEATWDGTNAAGNLVSSGVYFYKLSSKAGEISKKMLLQR